MRKKQKSKTQGAFIINQSQSGLFNTLELMQSSSNPSCSRKISSERKFDSQQNSDVAESGLKFMQANKIFSSLKLPEDQNLQKIVLAKKDISQLFSLIFHMREQYKRKYCQIHSQISDIKDYVFAMVEKLITESKKHFNTIVKNRQKKIKQLQQEIEYLKHCNNQLEEELANKDRKKQIWQYKNMKAINRHNNVGQQEKHQNKLNIHYRGEKVGQNQTNLSDFASKLDIYRQFPQNTSLTNHKMTTNQHSSANNIAYKPNNNKNISLSDKQHNLNGVDLRQLNRKISIIRQKIANINYKKQDIHKQFKQVQSPKNE